ncbi:hypothetical protein B0H10DRAFT_1960746 [Mycena sp. CBHHK59/15]|nr:hypothetical protein B0H10DRAFT_1960746 [Mycena sp. CBHHK59/15]
MPSHSPATSDDEMDDVFKAMDQSSPVRPTTTSTGDKRPRAAVDDKDQSEHELDTTENNVATMPGGALNQNTVASVQRFVAKKQLHGEQQDEVTAFLKDPPALREAKLYVQGLFIENMIGKILVATPPWAVSPDLNKNIYSYGTTILLSTQLSAYKGNIPKQILYAILKKHRFDLPPGIEHNSANWVKVCKAVQEAFTQLRSKVKKAIGASLYADTKKDGKAKQNGKGKAPMLLPAAQRKNIFELTQTIAIGTECEVNVGLCARVALMRKAFIKDPSKRFWNTVDKDLDKIRKKANGDAKMVIKAFRHILTEDRKKHGVNDYEIEDTVNAFQEDADKVVETVGATAAAAPDDEPEDDE